MARATHLTIGTADRIRLDAECCNHAGKDHAEGRNGENEVRQEVQVSVTYALEAGDTNLVRLAEAKALEVQLAHEAVWNRIGAFSRSNSSGSAVSSTSGQCSFGHDEDESDENESEDDPLAGLPQRGDDPFGGRPTPAGAARPFPAAPTNRETQNGGGPPLGGRYFPDALSRTGSQAPAPGADWAPDPAPDADPVSGPQKILIRSRAKKVGLTPHALESLVYQQFKVWKVEKLTKEQAASLLDALERDLKRMDLKEKERTEDEKESAVHGSDRHHGVTAGTA